jgi:folylpolyglutamate synthase/dihydropteroate synthase
MPGYFRFLTLLAFHTFLALKVNATVLEVGVGGTHDSTNIVPKPIVTGITALGIDHVTVLGPTLKDIAWQKAGIFKVSPKLHLHLSIRPNHVSGRRTRVYSDSAERGDGCS